MSNETFKRKSLSERRGWIFNVGCSTTGKSTRAIFSSICSLELGFCAIVKWNEYMYKQQICLQSIKLILEKLFYISNGVRMYPLPAIYISLWLILFPYVCINWNHDIVYLYMTYNTDVRDTDTLICGTVVIILFTRNTEIKIVINPSAATDFGDTHSSKETYT